MACALQPCGGSAPADLGWRGDAPGELPSSAAGGGVTICAGRYTFDGELMKREPDAYCKRVARNESSALCRRVFAAMCIVKPDREDSLERLAEVMDAPEEDVVAGLTALMEDMRLEGVGSHTRLLVLA